MQKDTHAKKLHEDIGDVISDSKNLLDATAQDISEKSKEVREELSARFETAKSRFSEAAADLKEKALEGAKETDRVIRKNPYQSLGIALVGGLLLGAILNRR